MSTSRAWQLDDESARRYEDVVVPFVLGPSARALVDWAGPRLGERVLDVGCGTGIAARHALKLVDPDGTVTGVDLNAGMLAVARQLAPEVDFHQADALALPFPDDSFDLVVCAQVLQFLPDRVAAITEAARVLAPGGRAAFSVWAALEESPYFAAQVNVVAHHLGEEVAGGLAAGFTLSSEAELADLLSAGGLVDPEVTTATLDLALGRLDELVPRHIKATPLAGAFESADDEVRARVISDMAGRLTAYTQSDGTKSAPFRIILARASKAG